MIEAHERSPAEVWDEAGRSPRRGEQPGEERPVDGVNNAGVGERVRPVAEILEAATPQGGKRHGGQRDSRGSCGDGGEKPLKGVVPMDDPA